MKKRMTWSFDRMHPIIQMLFRAVQYTLAFIGALTISSVVLIFIDLMLAFLQSL